ncbi:hypothetical protein [Phenylobacterium sp.]|jgi:predicted  nucleic acid-binding Zn-ribbon protein|uniref:hypothetical protein n=1 Tax=Phenylobacterium sp. TaxID=1871053 RepID=UPI002810BCC9|nr:hypothetical protein [Phenylobacterium sp.]
MSIENHPGYARWQAAKERLEDAKLLLDQVTTDAERAVAQREVDDAQEEYDAAVDAIVG